MGEPAGGGAVAGGAGAVRQPVRALTGWMDAEARGRLDRDGARRPLPDPALALRDRPPLDQTGLLAPMPAALAGHAAALRAGEAAQRMFAQGWELALVADLRRVIAAQPTVSGARAPAEPPDPDPGDLEAIAALTLPLAPPAPEIAYSLDEPAQTWQVSSPNPNLRISGTFGGELQPGVNGFGFLFSVMTSYVSVVECEGRHVLRDGYHRTYRLLAAGVTQAPAFVRRQPPGEALFRHGMLPEAVYLGDRPPTLADYHDDAVSTDAWLTEHATQARVQATPTRLAIGTIA